jgi:hypothetical protein
MSSLIPVGYDYTPHIDWWNNDVNNVTPASSYRSIPIGTSRQFRTIFIDSQNKSSNPLDNSNLVWSVESYIPSTLSFGFYTPTVPGGKNLRTSGALDDIDRNVTSEIAAATGIPLTQIIPLSQIDPSVDISNWYTQDANNAWTLKQEYKGSYKTGFCNLNEDQITLLNNYLKNHNLTYTVTNEGGIPFSFNGNDIATVDNTGLVQMKSPTSAVIKVSLKNTNLTQSFKVRAIANSLEGKSNSQFYVEDAQLAQSSYGPDNVTFCPSPSSNVDMLRVISSRDWDPIWLMKHNNGLAFGQIITGWMGQIKEDLSLKNGVQVYFNPVNLADKEAFNIEAFSLSNPRLKGSQSYIFTKVCTPLCSQR